MNDPMKSERLALVKAGRAERASTSRRAKILAIGAGVAVGATLTTTSTAAAATAASAASSTSIPVSAAAAGASFAGWKMVVVAAGVLAASGVAAVAVAVNERSATPPRVESSRMASPPSPTSTTTAIPNARPPGMPTMSVGDLPSAKGEAPRVARASTSTPATAPAPAPASSLADEMKSAEAIRSAAREGRTDDAMRLLDEHDARFPNGALGEEVEVLRIESLARAGRSAEAKRLAERFVRERPNSPYAPRVRSTISRLE